MSLFDSYDAEVKAALNPEDVYDRVEGFPETVIVTFKKAIVDIVLEQFECEPVGTLLSGTVLEIHRFKYKGKEFAIYQTTMGSPMTAGLMEEVIAMGGKRFVYFGSCGTLDRDIPAGHLIVPTAAYRDEGTSYHYRPASAGDFVDIKTADQTASVIEEMGLKYIKTKTWTTDGLYRETRRNMNNRLAAGCRVVDMECSAIMTVADYRGVNAWQFLYAEDNLDDIVWDPRTLGKVPKSANELYLKVALEIAHKGDSI
ncbi:MAG: nucleoside phosphorylase [Eubacteriaceae bacterium]|nr:nucleoside phosphorylase [Eubacteriaceae bacterium]